MNLSTLSLSSIGQLLQIAVIIGLAGFAIYQGFTKGKKDKSAEADADGERLVSLLKSTVDELSGRVKRLEDDNQVLKQQLDSMRTENSSLRDVLQGRDKASIDFQEKVLNALLSIEQENAKTLSAVRDLYKAIVSRQAPITLS